MGNNAPDNFPTSVPSRVGLFGGTFNPVHMGHLRSMLEVRDELELDQVIVIPSAIPPHKTKEGLVDSAYRLEMLQKAVAGMDDFIVSDIELHRDGPSYTIDTVKYYKKILETSKDLFLIMGLDAFLELDTWKAYEELLSLISVIIMVRPGKWVEEGKAAQKLVENFLKTSISQAYTLSNSGGGFIHPQWQTVYLQNVTPLDISSTGIRDLLKKGRSITYLVERDVEDFIYHKRLYI